MCASLSSIVVAPGYKAARGRLASGLPYGGTRCRYIASPAAETRSPSHCSLMPVMPRARTRPPSAKTRLPMPDCGIPVARDVRSRSRYAPPVVSVDRCHGSRSFPSLADARNGRAPTRTASPRRLAEQTGGDLRPSDCSAFTPGGKSSGRVGLQRLDYAGIDRRKTVPQQASHGNANGHARRMERRSRAFGLALAGRHGRR